MTASAHPAVPAPLGLTSSLGLLGRLVLGSGFIVSGFTKAVAPVQEFAYAIEGFQLLGSDMAMNLAYVLPWAELFLGAFVLTGYFRRPSAALLTGLLGVFMFALGQAQLKGIELGTCGCFGSLLPPLEPWQAMTLDAVLIAAAWAVWRDRIGRFSLDAWIEAGVPAAPLAAGPGEKLRKVRA